MALGVHLAAPPIVVSADLETIQERGYLIVAVKDNWRPLGFLDDEETLVGFEIDIATRLAETLFGDPTAVVLLPVANRDRIPAVLDGQVDLAIAGLAITPMRQRVVSFSTPYYLDGTAVITQDPQVMSLADLGDDAIALLEGSEAVTEIHYRLPVTPLIGVPSYEAARTAIESERVNAFAGDVTVLTGWVQEYPEYRLLPELLTVEPLAIAMPKGNQYISLRRFVDGTLSDWHENGWLETRSTYWGLP